MYIMYDYDTLVLSGGGAKGYCYLGVFKYLEEKNIIINRLGGTSIGSLFAFLYCVLSFKDLYNEILQFDYTIHNNIQIINFMAVYGLDDFSGIRTFIFNILDKYKINRNITFNDLKNSGKELCINALCINDKRKHYFNYVNTPDMPIITAVQASMAIPMLFVPVQYNEQLYIDPGLFENFMIEHDWFNNKANVLGINLIYCNNRTHLDINSMYDYTQHLIMCLFENLTNKINSTSTIINIECYQNFLDLELCLDDKLLLYKFGYNKISDYFTKK